jgi:5-methylcytosine-specific restriction protein A
VVDGVCSNALSNKEAKQKINNFCELFQSSFEGVDAMPRAAPTPCRHPGCGAVLTTPGYCDAHRAGVHRDYSRARRGFDTERGFYQSVAWRAVRSAFLREHPLCAHCAARGRVVAAVVADHVVPIKEGGARFDTSNCQALCISHHNAKTASETARRSRRI